MSRTVRDAKLESRAERARLKARGKPYYRMIDPGLHLGYRRLRGGPGKWAVRYYKGGRAYALETIATADDLSDSNKADVLSFAEAQDEARNRRDARSRSAAGITGPITVADAMDGYLASLEDDGRSDAAIADARCRVEAFIKPKLGERDVASLETSEIKAWHAGLARAAPRVRTKKDAEQQHRKIGVDDEARRRRKSSANRTFATLRAGLNHAFRNSKNGIPTDKEWRNAKPFKAVSAARVRYLELEEAQRLVNACEPDFRKLVQAGLQTGCRYGELARLKMADFNRRAGTMQVTRSKTGKARHVVLTDEGVSFFKQVCAGRGGDELIFKNGERQWGKSHQGLPMREACKRAKIKPAVGFHTLRHTWASHAVMNGVPLLVVAKNLGHSDTRMVEKHYGHLAPSYIVDAIRAGAPKFGFEPDNVRAIR